MVGSVILGMFFLEGMAITTTVGLATFGVGALIMAAAASCGYVIQQSMWSREQVHKNIVKKVVEVSRNDERIECWVVAAQ